MTDIFSLNWRDIARSCLSAVFIAVLGYVSNLSSLTSLDGKTIASVAILTFVKSLAERLSTDSQGKLGGVL